MGLDTPNIYQIIHYGPSKSADRYIQESGRGGRDGKQTVALCIAAHTSTITDREMRDYIANKDVCRRQRLFQTILGSSICKPTSMFKCCDVCSNMCKCGQCIPLHNIIQ